MRLFFILILFTNFSLQLLGSIQEPLHHKLHVTLENAPFDSLYLHDYTNGRNLLFAAEKIKPFTWVVAIPDSVVFDFQTMELIPNSSDTASYLSHKIRFITDHSGEQLAVVNIGVDDRDTYIKGRYREQKVFEDGTYFNKEGQELVNSLYCEDFDLIIEDKQTDIAVRAADPLFSWFMDYNGAELSYDDFLNNYIALARKHPDSRFLINSLANNLRQYRSKDDIMAVYNELSNKHKTTLWGSQIERFLTGEFVNLSLRTIDTAFVEDIIQDRSKHNFIIFTASWCVWCREEIPLLKQLYNDLGKDIVFTYISLDEERALPTFRKLLEKDHIPWRTLLAYQDIKRVKNQYFVESLPHHILVYPNGEMEALEVRKEEDRNKLYALD